MTAEDRRKWLDAALIVFGILDEWQIRFVSDVSRLDRAGKEVPDRKVEVLNNIFLRMWQRRMVPHDGAEPDEARP